MQHTLDAGHLSLRKHLNDDTARESLLSEGERSRSQSKKKREKSLEEEYQHLPNIVDKGIYVKPCVLARAGCCSRIFFGWGHGFIKALKQKQCSIEDMGGLYKSDHIQPKHIMLEKVYRAQNPRRKDLLVAVFVAFLKEFCIAFFWCMSWTLSNLIAPFILDELITFLKEEVANNGSEKEMLYGYQLVALLVVTQFISYVSVEHVYYYQLSFGVKASNALVAMIYNKQLRVSSATNKKFGHGQIVNFVQTDSQQLIWLCYQMSTISSIPLILTTGFVYLFYKLGISFFSGVLVFIIASVANFIIGVVLQRLNEEIMKRKDSRMNATQESLNNIKTLKFYSWVGIFEKQINNRRTSELHVYWKNMIWMSLTIASLYFFPDVLSTVCMTTYIGLGNSIDLATATSCLLFFKLIQDPLRQLPLFFTQYIQMKVSMKRIEEFLNCDEIDQSKLIKRLPGEHEGLAIEINGQNFSWGVKDESEEGKDKKKQKSAKESKAKKDKKKVVSNESFLEEDEPSQITLDRSPSAHQISSHQLFDHSEMIQGSADSNKDESNAKTLETIITLKDIDLKVKKGQFVCIIGDVGSGKSSLLNTLIGDLLCVNKDMIMKYGGSLGLKKEIVNPEELEDFQKDLVSGVNENINEPPITIAGSTAYVQQVPWIQNKTIRDNILYGLDLDKEKYVDTIRFCELERDLEILQAGDLTEIGEKGINLSGGQKARIGLARAVYQDNDIFLMDDPISALDANVRKKIMMNVVLGCLKKKTRILVTHAIDFVQFADHIIIMDNGRISAQGSVYELRNNERLQKLLDINSLDQSLSPQRLQESHSPINIETFRESQMMSPRDDGSIKISGRYDDSLKLDAHIQTMAKDTEILLSSMKLSVMHEVMSKNEKLIMFDKLGMTTTQDDGKIIKDENDEIVNVNLSTYMKLAKLGGGWFIFGMIQITLLLFIGCTFLTSIVLEVWSDDLEGQQDKFKTYSLINVGLVAGTGLFVGLRCIGIFVMQIKASKVIHKQIVNKVMHAPINLYFDVTPTGTIMNRFSKDLSILDTEIAQQVGSVLVCFYYDLSILGAVVATNWYLVFILPLILGLTFWVFIYTIKAYREAQRLESVSKSPILNLLGECISGSSTIRAFKKEGEFIEKNYELLNKNMLANQISLVVWCWQGIRIDIITTLVIIISSVVSVYFRSSENQALVANLFVQILQFQIWQSWLIYSMGVLERQMVSIERLFKILDIPQENEESRLKLPESVLDEWPKQGNISFNDVHLRYRPKTDLVLKGLSFDVQGGHKVGIVGRTGAGKSTISLALTRIVELEKGSIMIDGINISDMSMNHLRKKVTIIPQDPTLFIGTLRFNIDPSGTVSDEDILKLLKSAGLDDLLKRERALISDQKKDKAGQKKKKKSQLAKNDPERMFLKDNDHKNELDMEITENGQNLSSGERQLICICRAILRKNKIILLDEATANIDIVTEQKIQALIQKEFIGCTLIVIAHRLKTIIDSDMVLVLGNGQVLEYDSPANLLENDQTEFARLVNELRAEQGSDCSYSPKMNVENDLND